MPADTDPRLPAARNIDVPTARTPAVYPGDAHPAVTPPPVDDPGPGVEPYPAEWATSNLSPLAQEMHHGCGCDWGGDIDGHGGVDYEHLAEQERAALDGEPIDTGQVAAPPAPRAPVEAKVVAGAWSTLAAAVVLALSTAGLQQIDTVRVLIGDNPWSGPAVLAIGVVLTAAQSWAAYQAPHTPRPGGQVPR